MNKAVAAIVVGVSVVLALFAVLTLRVSQPTPALPESPLATLPSYGGTPAVRTSPPYVPLVSPSPTMEVLTPEKEQLTDLESEEEQLTLDTDFDADLKALDQEARNVR